eukprot:CAMPEP_0173173458 /NCGR_PEP_ID=MMETSP1141-20130122/2841_1 /TAXON_ID=483371 /ORGANISM="non described non described, Strain CCMP2298" /LENGTH=178 /DNA_ID=CAMNT_0014095539 /DNA_START=45 /DNA_END=584 /DNA_ORIENTATION=-
MASRLGLKEFCKKFPVISKVSVKWGDMDAYQHVNNCMYLKYQEVSRLRYFSLILKEVDPTKFNAKAFSNGTGVGPILSDTYCKFIYPLTFPDMILVGCTIEQGDLSKNRYKLTHAVWSMQHQRVVSEGFGTVVSYDFPNKKVADVPEQLVKAIGVVQARDSLHLHDKLAAMTNLEDEF